jgi:hypothetical protein
VGELPMSEVRRHGLPSCAKRPPDRHAAGRSGS